jgi:type IV pilus assembly protein PilE
MYYKIDRNFYRSRLIGFTLPELLIVLVIIGILILLAMPRLMPLISQAKSTEAQLQLRHLYTLEKTYFYLHSKYSLLLEEVGFEQEKSVAEGGNANYFIEIIEAEIYTFKGRATALVDFDGDGIFNIWEIDQDNRLTEISKD